MFNFIGNQQSCVRVKMHLQWYISYSTQEDKTNLIKSIIWMLHEVILCKIPQEGTGQDI